MAGAHHNINLQPSFRGALHARDEQQHATAAPHVNFNSSADPSPLLGYDQQHLDDGGAISPGNNSGATINCTDGHASWRHPIASTKTYFSDLSSYFGWQFLSWLAIEQCFISGGVFALTMAISLPLFKELGIGASQQQLYQSLIFSPWAMKPVGAEPRSNDLLFRRLPLT